MTRISGENPKTQGATRRQMGDAAPAVAPHQGGATVGDLIRRLVSDGFLDRGVIFVVEGDNHMRPAAAFPDDPTRPDAPGWLERATVVAQQAMSTAGPVVAPLESGDHYYSSNEQAYLVAFDLTISGQPKRALAGTMTASSKRTLQSRVSSLALVISLLRRDPGSSTDVDQHLRQQMAVIMKMAVAVGRHRVFRAAATELCDQVASQWPARRVGLGMRSGTSGIKLRAVNGVDHFTRRMPVTRAIEAAMEECVDQGEPVVYPPPDGSDVVCRAAKTLADEYHAGQVICLPVAAEDTLRGVLIVETEPRDQMPIRAIEGLQLAMDLCGPTIAQRYDHGRWVGARLAASARRTGAMAVGTEHTWAKLTAIALLAVVVFLVVAKGMYRVDAPFVLETVQRHVVSAPFAEELVWLDALPGDQVEAGQPLARLRTTELHQRLADLKAQRRVDSEEADLAIRDGKTAESMIAMARVDQTDAQIELLQLQLNRASIAAPIHGVIVEGDLRQRLYGQFEDGEAMFEVAPLNAMRATIMVPEGQINQIKIGMTGELAAAANPSQRIGITVSRIEPLARMEDGHNVFTVWTELDQQPDWALAGMEGIAKIDIDRRRYAWIWTRSAVNWVRMRLWF